MSFQVKEPILVIGLGGAGSKLAIQAKDSLNSDCLIISNDQKDLQSGYSTIKVSTDSVINPSIQLIRGSAYKVADQIKSKISNYSTIVLMANLAGKTGAAISPVVSEICKESDKAWVAVSITPLSSLALASFTSFILSLIDDVKGNVDEAAAKKLMDKVKKGKGFDLNDFIV